MPPLLQAPSVRAIKLQYFLAYGVIGSLAPFLSLLLKEERGLQDAQIGLASGASSAAAILMPLVMGSLADLRQDARRLLALVFGVSAVALSGLVFAQGFWPIVLLLCLHSLAYVATTPLQDGLNFALQQRRAESGQAAVPFHQIRVWGTVGFIVPSVLLFGFLAQGTPLRASLFAAVGFCVLGVINSLRLPASPPPVALEAGAKRSQAMPVLSALRVLRRPPVFVLCVCLMLANMASASYYAFYPLYLSETIGVSRQWVGPIFNVGVVFEIGFMLLCGWGLKRLGFKRFMLLGLACLSARLALLAACPHVAVAIGTQLVHGMIVVALHVAPALYLNRQAGDEYRTSMQGLLAVLTGASRVLGSIVAGRLAGENLLTVFAWAGALSLSAVIFFALAFRIDWALDRALGD